MNEEIFPYTPKELEVKKMLKEFTHKLIELHGLDADNVDQIVITVGEQVQFRSLSRVVWLG